MEQHQLALDVKDQIRPVLNVAFYFAWKNYCMLLRLNIEDKRKIVYSRDPILTIEYNRFYARWSIRF